MYQDYLSKQQKVAAIAHKQATQRAAMQITKDIGKTAREIEQMLAEGASIACHAQTAYVHNDLAQASAITVAGATAGTIFSRQDGLVAVYAGESPDSLYRLFGYNGKPVSIRLRGQFGTPMPAACFAGAQVLKLVGDPLFEPVRVLLRFGG